MTNLVCKRVSTDQQSTARQNLVLDEAGIEDPVVFEEDPDTSSRPHPPPAPEVPRTAHLTSWCVIAGDVFLLVGDMIRMWRSCSVGRFLR
ncbi:hypothetical protein AB0D53_40150, partial [Streptomyces sp. NPDC048295]